jgi:hypothetical protein
LSSLGMTKFKVRVMNFQIYCKEEEIRSYATLSPWRNLRQDRWDFPKGRDMSREEENNGLQKEILGRKVKGQ